MPRDLRGRVIIALTVGAVGEVVWTVLLGLHLPSRYSAHHWVLAWVGLDVMEIVLLLATAYCGWRLWTGPLTIVASVTGTLYLLDAWFDVTTAGSRDAGAALGLIFLEVPLAGVLFWVATRALQRHRGDASRSDVDALETE